MDQPKKTKSVPIIIAILITAVVVGGGVYYWQTLQAPVVNVEKTNEVDSKNIVVSQEGAVAEVKITEPEQNKMKAQFETMEEYVKLCIDTTESTTAPSGLIQVKFGEDNPVDVKLPGADVPIYVYAENWGGPGNMEEAQMFYLKSESPSSYLEDSTAQKQELWCGPYYGKLKLLVQ